MRSRLSARSAIYIITAKSDGQDAHLLMNGGGKKAKPQTSSHNGSQPNSVVFFTESFRGKLTTARGLCFSTNVLVFRKLTSFSLWYE